MFGVGGGKLVFVVMGNPRAFPLNETLVSVDSPVVVALLDVFGYLKVLYHGSANLPYTLHIPLHILKRASLARLRPVVYLSSAF